MKTQHYFGAIIVAALLAGTAAHAQEPIYLAPSPVPPPKSAAASDDKLVPATGGLSDWIVYRRNCCEGPHGAYTPLYTEFYFNAGPSFPVGGMTLSRELKIGWSFTGGVRALFFNEPHTSAWVVDGHIINTNESAGKQNSQFPVTFFEKGVRSDLVVFEGVAGRKTFSLQNSNRTLVGLGVGREWYLSEPANFDGCKWRYGVDLGGRWGSHRVNFNEFGHLVDVAGSIYAGAHGDVEFPWQSSLVHAGLRLEWAYTWTDVLQRVSDVQDLSVLFTVGIRY
ncbi:MAG: hypothetical protein EXR98_01360 [Gemmataceae bacterium]|nr:hypothetical protein [Gemmataceae bacterium]